MFFWELPLSLHVEHEISTIHIFNNEKESVKKVEKIYIFMTYYREKYKLCTFIESSEKHRTTAERHEGTEPGCHTLFAYYYILCV